MNNRRTFKRREVAELVEEALELGWIFVRFTAHESVMLVHPPTGKRISICQTPRCPVRAWRNVRSELRRPARGIGIRA